MVCSTLFSTQRSQHVAFLLNCSNRCSFAHPASYFLHSTTLFTFFCQFFCESDLLRMNQRHPQSTEHRHTPVTTHGGSEKPTEKSNPCARAGGVLGQGQSLWIDLEYVCPPPPLDPAARYSPLVPSSLSLSPPEAGSHTPSVRPTGLWRGTATAKVRWVVWVLLEPRSPEWGRPAAARRCAVVWRRAGAWRWASVYSLRIQFEESYMHMLYMCMHTCMSCKHVRQ